MTLIPDFLVTNRTPTLRLLRSHDVEPDAGVVILWNGTRAPNGDGVGGGDGLIDYVNPLAGPIQMWRGGHHHWLGGAFPGDEFPFFGAGTNFELGFCHGPFCAGPFGIGTDYMTWKFPFPLRDGDYRFMMLLVDALGNRRSEFGSLLAFRVEAPPRPPSGLSVVEASGFLQATFDPSPEFAAAA